MPKSGADLEERITAQLKRGAGWREVLEGSVPPALLAKLERHARPALRMVLRKAGGEGGGVRSRVGGHPQLPPGFRWPSHETKPLSFLAQLDLAEVAAVFRNSPLPSEGELCFFYSVDQPWGFDPKHSGGAVAVHLPPGPRVPTPPPATLPDGGSFAACAVTFQPYIDLPELQDHPALNGELSGDPYDLYQYTRNMLAHGDESVRNKLLGHANPKQGPMAEECAMVTGGLYLGNGATGEPQAAKLAEQKDDWNLLLQLDSNDIANMMWGDCGTLYFWIRDSDLKAGRFDRTWTILQCG